MEATPRDWSSTACENLPGEPGVSGYLKLGTTVAPQLLMGVEANGWRRDLEGTTITSVNASVVAYVYLKPTSRFFFKGGVGATYYREDVAVKYPEDTAGTTGFGLTAGVGYDLRVGDNVSVTPVANFVFGSLGNIRHRGLFIPNVQATLLQLALGVTFH